LPTFLLRRLLLAIPTLAGVLIVVFLLLYVAPGDPVQEMVGERADAETIARLRRELRLDDPVPVQFVHYAGGVLRGDLGTSYITGRPILRDIAERFPKTLLLAATAMVLAAVVGITIGVVSARWANGWLDRFSLGAAYLGISFPVYWVGLLFILLFAVTLRWLPPSGYGRPEFLVLPALALGSRSIAFLARVTRSSMLEVLGSDFVRTARAKGLIERAVVVRHALRNALIPVITVLGVIFGFLMAGNVVVEIVFAWPGIGNYAVTSLMSKDSGPIQSFVLFVAVVYVLVNLAVDLAYGLVDPRIRLR
jgi:peptide/nickel transport system permease protein